DDEICRKRRKEPVLRYEALDNIRIRTRTTVNEEEIGKVLIRGECSDIQQVLLRMTTNVCLDSPAGISMIARLRSNLGSPLPARYEQGVTTVASRGLGRGSSKL